MLQYVFTCLRHFDIAQGTYNGHNLDPWPVDYLIREIIKFYHKSLLPDSSDNIPSHPPTPIYSLLTHRPRAAVKIVVTAAAAMVAVI